MGGNTVTEAADRKTNSQDFGLEAGLVFSKYFLNTEHLHYGYWTDDLPVEIANLRQAQDRYCEFVISHIPEGVESILDVGCGNGTFASRLGELGYDVDCVAPSPFLASETDRRLHGRTQIFNCRYEDLVAHRKYDLIFFSESFQYIDLVKGLAMTASVLNDAGHVLICDFFKKDVEGSSPIGGGKSLRKFHDAIGQHPLQIVEDVDITEKTAPTMDLANEMCVEVVSPIWQSLFGFLDSRHPIVMKAVRWKFKKQLEKMERKYFQGERTGARFSDTKSYRLLLMKNGNATKS